MNNDEEKLKMALNELSFLLNFPDCLVSVETVIDETKGRLFDEEKPVMFSMVVTYVPSEEYKQSRIRALQEAENMLKEQIEMLTKERERYGK